MHSDCHKHKSQFTSSHALYFLLTCLHLHKSTPKKKKNIESTSNRRVNKKEAQSNKERGQDMNRQTTSHLNNLT